MTPTAAHSHTPAAQHRNQMILDQLIRKWFPRGLSYWHSHLMFKVACRGDVQDVMALSSHPEISSPDAGKALVAAAAEGHLSVVLHFLARDDIDEHFLINAEHLAFDWTIGDVIGGRLTLLLGPRMYD